MLTHALLGTNDLARSKTFYDATLGALGVPPGAEAGTRVFYNGGKGPGFGIGSPADGNAATHANGGTLGFVAKDKESIHAWHEAGLANGGTCEGAPGPRPYFPDAYGAYLRDPDGNKICVFLAPAE